MLVKKLERPLRVRNKSVGFERIDDKYEAPLFYYRWRAMRSRCESEACPEYKRYGARGIYV